MPCAVPVLLALLLPMSASSAESSSLQISARMRGGVARPASLTVRLESAGDLAVADVSLQTGAAVISKAAGSEWDLTVASRGYWTAPRRVTFPAADKTLIVDLEVWPTGEVAGVMSVGEGTA